MSWILGKREGQEWSISDCNEDLERDEADFGNVGGQS